MMNRKLTRGYIRKLILEEIEGISEDPLSIEDMSEPHPERDRHDAWAGGDNIHVNIDHPKAAGSEETVQGQEVMQIVGESELRSLIWNVILEDS